jgi:hypothetical protein
LYLIEIAARTDGDPAARKAAFAAHVEQLQQLLEQREYPEYETAAVLDCLQEAVLALQSDDRRRRVQRVQDRGRFRAVRRPAATDEPGFIPQAKRGRKAQEATFEYRTDEELALALRQIREMERRERGLPPGDD